jgi:hypothetical protein
LWCLLKGFLSTAHNRSRYGPFPLVEPEVTTKHDSDAELDKIKTSTKDIQPEIPPLKETYFNIFFKII